MEGNIKQIGKACTGCRACEQVCPENCIKIQEDKEGFLYPSVQSSRCIGCGLCLKSCAGYSAFEAKEAPKVFYGFKNKNSAELFRSASGGVSDVAAKVMLQKGGVVFGASYDDNFEVKHICITKDSERCRLQSSKYVQSDTGHCFTRAKEYLEKGRPVLFTGTPCQIDGLYHFLGKSYENLYTIDLICHGVPSPLFFRKYTEYISRKMKGELTEYNFRSKEKRGWGTNFLIKTKNKTKTGILSLDKYGKHFTAGDCYRESCYSCPYTDIHKRPADLTAGDFWGADKTRPELNTRLGISSVTVNSEKGNRLIDMMREYAEIIPLTLPEVLAKQGNLVHPAGRPETRNTFYKNISEEDFIDRLHVGLMPGERLKALLPGSLVKALKKIVR